MCSVFHLDCLLAHNKPEFPFIFLLMKSLKQEVQGAIENVRLAVGIDANLCREKLNERGIRLRIHIFLHIFLTWPDRVILIYLQGFILRLPSVTQKPLK